ncbi:hypothetical protein D9611_010716 [Ephemerocybe angulata]|uniref:Uncharacterized protein n=1 Tax=Ephemerocybe angulata TaxID=980116 RepID=A0A8H5F203_9AGAR|nr:hypothetical protein D9611_010716 [Tulosesus angulatus]
MDGKQTGLSAYGSSPPFFNAATLLGPRSEAKGAALKANLIQDLQDKGTEDLAFETFVIEDLLKHGAFDETVLGVDAVLHLASPTPKEDSTDPEDTIRPAVDGTLGVLRTRSALRASQRDPRVGV